MTSIQFPCMISSLTSLKIFFTTFQMDRSIIKPWKSKEPPKLSSTSFV